MTIKEKRVTGYAVCDDRGVVKDGPLPASVSAQEVELYALAQDGKLLEGENVTIDTNSRYVFDVVHDFGTLLSQWGMLTATGTPIKKWPLPRSRGKTHALVVVDRFSRWTEVFATSSASANLVAQTLIGK